MNEQLQAVNPPGSLSLYPTPEWATAELLKRLPIEHGDVILDPASGDNAIAKVIKDFSNRVHVFTNDIDPNKPTDFHFDMALRESWKWIDRSTGGFDWVIGNPPFTSAVPPGKKRGKPIIHLFIQMGYQYARKGVVFLLSKSFTEPVSYRRSWLQTYSHEQFMELRLERIRFRCDRRNDEVACDWYGWQHGHSGGFVPEYIWR
ncbi:MAG TPA: Eco57I restriction-modification methylase domain-containing protein [Candidatus Obscuribacterales bacterium]|jgi:hypothetical protein